MVKPKTLEQLRAEKERAETQLAKELYKPERAKNRKKYPEEAKRPLSLQFGRYDREPCLGG